MEVEDTLNKIIEQLEFLTWKMERLHADIEALRDRLQWYLSDQ